MPLTRIQSDALKDAITSSNIADGTVATADLASGAVTAPKMAAGAVENYMTTNGTNFMFRNKIINGDMRIDQRNNGGVVSSSIADDAYYNIDRWYARQNVASKFSVHRSASYPTGFSNSLQITSLSSYALGASDFFATTQPIEGFNIADLAWGTASASSVTLSFWVRSSVTGTFGGHINNHDSTMTYVYSYSVNSANTWEYKTITIPGPTSGTWMSNNTVGLYLTFSFGSGSSTTRAVGWGSFARSVTGQVSVVATNSATFNITGVQLETGSVATPFERRPFATELAMCQRYYYNTYQNGISTGVENPPVIGSVYYYQSGAVAGSWKHPVRMRATPSVTFYESHVNISPGNTTFSSPTVTADFMSYVTAANTTTNGYPARTHAAFNSEL